MQAVAVEAEMKPQLFVQQVVLAAAVLVAETV
jgi:hypothetical protein